LSPQEEHIRKIFSESLEHFEAPVDPSVWAGVQSGIGAGTAGAGGLGSFALLKIVAALVVATGIITAVVISTGQEETNSKSSEVEQVENPQSDVEIDADTPSNIVKTEEEGQSLSTSDTKRDIIPDQDVSPGTVVIPPSDEPLSEVAPVEEPVQAIKSYEIGRGAPAVETPEEHIVADPIDEKAVVDFSAGFVAKQDEYTYNLLSFTPATIVDGEYVWDFGDGETSIGSSATHEYFDDGTYNVTLSVKVGDQEKVEEVIVLITEPSQIMVPNVFSPNGDIWNNYFDIEAESKNVELISLVVFDQQGNRVFEADSYRKKWDGNDLFGDPCSAGIYSYWFEAHGHDGKHWKNAGTVTLKHE
jgi:gliding motility-associated-like protein